MHPPVHSDIGKANAKLSIAAGSSECHHFSKYIVRHESDFMREKYCATETNCGAEGVQCETGKEKQALPSLFLYNVGDVRQKREKSLDFVVAVFTLPKVLGKKVNSNKTDPVAFAQK
jgi:hypothetical protein